MVRNPDRTVPFEGRTLLVVALGYMSGFVLVAFILSVMVDIRDISVLLVALLVPFIPFLIMMASNEQVRRIAAGSGGFNFEIVFNRAVKSEIRPITLEDQVIDIPPPQMEVPVPGYPADDGVVEHRSVLWFRLGEWVDPGTVDDFVAHMPRLSYVIFTDPLGQLNGLMSANDFLAVYRTNPEGVLKKIESESVLDIAGMVTETITPKLPMPKHLPGWRAT